MKKLRNNFDSWNIIEKYNINDYIVKDTVIMISNKEYNNIINNVKNKQYIKNLTIY